MMVVACFCLSLSILIRLEMRPNLKAFALLGLSLGIGYWTKAIMFPLGFVTLFVAWVWGRSSSAWTRGVALATLVFVCLSAPLVLAISRQKGRFTFGDSGKINYAWFVSPRTPPRNWQGEEPGSGPPLHPTRRILKSPPVFEFDGPVVGTYPPWTDPSYWNEGLHQHFELKSQLRVLARTVPMELHVLLRKRPELVFGVVLLALLALPTWLAGIRDLWPFVLLPIAGMSLYLPLVENDRYLGGFVLVLFLAILRAVRTPQNIGPVVRLVVLTMACLMFLSTIEHTIRILTRQFAEGQGPNSTLQDEIAARYLRGKKGTLSYTKVAIISDGTDAYWARLGKLRIVAEIMGGRGEAEFLDSPEEVRKSVYQAFRETGAKLIVMSLESCQTFKVEGWESIPGTQYYVHCLE